MVEYALILAVVVILAAVLTSSGIDDSIRNTFNNVANTLNA